MALIGPTTCVKHVWEWTGMAAVKCLVCKAVERTGHAQKPGGKYCIECEEEHS
jgi:hypothetical protein